MPWCPKCEMEYQSGIISCPDCKVDLVEDLYKEEVLVPFLQTEDKKTAEKLVRFFKYSDLNASDSYDEEQNLYIVSVPPKKVKQAEKLYKAFYIVERDLMANGAQALKLEEDNDIEVVKDTEEDSDSDDIEETIESDDDFDNEEEDSHNFMDDSDESSDEDYIEPITNDSDHSDEEDSHAYVMKSDQYKDLTGTVWVFLMFGIVGLIVVILNIIGILNLFQGIIPNAVMGILFLLFLYIALSTAQRAKKVQSEIEAENQLTEEINQWLTVNVTEDFLSSISNDNLTSEMNYLKAVDNIKEMLLKEFGPQNLAYLDRLIEEYYTNTFDKAD
ncbi:MAG: hypothetical protein WBI07_18360 [Mobilitalea sp.]